MEVSLQDRTIRKDGIRPAAPPNYRPNAETIGFDLSNSPAPSICAGGLARASSQGMGLLMRGPVEGHVFAPQAAGQFLDLADFPREHGASESLTEWKSASRRDQPPFICLLFSFAANRIESLIHQVERTL